VTGSSALDVDEVAARLATIRQFSHLPIGVGFGIKDAESAAAVARCADGVVVGSVLVNRVAELAWIHQKPFLPNYSVLWLICVKQWTLFNFIRLYTSPQT
jgi:tryptophan synthase alpha subunit